MSQQAVYEVDFEDEGVLVEALKEMGFTATIHEKAIQLKTYGGRNSVKANIVISQNQHGFSYGDMGFERVENGGLKLHADHIDIKKLDMSQLKQKYMKVFIAKKIRLFGTKYVLGEETVDQQGTIKLRVECN